MNSRRMLIGIFGFWSLLIVAAFFKYALSYDPFFSTAKNIIYRYQNRGEIRDRNGEILAYGSGFFRKYPLGPAGSPIIGAAKPEIGVEGFIEREYGERLISSKRSKLWYLLTQLPHFSDQNLYKSMGYDII